MTPADHARLIEKQEFEAERQAVRKRALTYAHDRRSEEQQRVQRWIETPVEEIVTNNHNAEQRARIERKRRKTPTPERTGKVGRPLKFYTIDGVTKNLDQWADVAGCEPHTLQMRLFSGIPLETAVTMKPRQRTRTKAHTVNGVSKTLKQWAEHLGITYAALIKRLKIYTLAEAVAMPKGQHRRKTPGVSSDLEAWKGTGAGRNAQAIQNITFEETAE